MEEIKIIQIEKKYEDEFVKTFNGSYFDSIKEARQHFNEYLKNKKLFLLLLDSELAGFFNYYFQYSHHANYLEDMGVSKKFRRKGCSKHLISKYIEISKEHRSKNRIALSSTHKKNIASQKMHINFGFKKIGILKGLHYGEDEIFYSYDLE